MLELKLKLKVEGKGTGKGKADAEAEGIPGTTIAFTFGQGICIRWCDDVIETKHLIINYNRETDETSDRTNEQATRPNCRPIFQKNDPVRPRCGPGAETGPAQSSISNKKKSVQKQIPTLRCCLCRRRRRPHIRRNLGNVLTAPSNDCAKKFNTLPKISVAFLLRPPKQKCFYFCFFFTSSFISFVFVIDFTLVLVLGPAHHFLTFTAHWVHFGSTRWCDQTARQEYTHTHMYMYETLPKSTGIKWWVLIIIVFTGA